MPTVLNNEFLSIINSTNYLPQYIGSKDFPLNLDERINCQQFISYLNHSFSDKNSFNMKIFDCKSSIFRRMTRVFAKGGEDFYKICGNQHESYIKGNKIIYFSKKYIYNLLYLKLNNNKFDVSDHLIPWSSSGNKNILLYSLYFVNQDTANFIKNDAKYAGLINYQYRSANVLNVYEAIFIDSNKYFLADFDNCQVVQVLLKKTCDMTYITIYHKPLGTSFRQSKFACQEEISARRCINLQDLLSSSSVPVIRHNRKLFSNNSQMNNNNLQEIQLSNWDAVALLVFISSAIMAAMIFICVYVYKRFNPFNKDVANISQQNNTGTALSKDEGDIERKNLLLEKIEEVVDKNSSISQSVC